MSIRSKAAILQMMKSAGLFALARARARRGVRILCYHGVWTGPDRFAGDSMFISKRTFEDRLALLRKLDFKVISLDQAVQVLRGNSAVVDGVVITIDDGWHSTFSHMLPALKRHGMHATIYCDTKNLTSGFPVPHVMARYLRDIHAKDSCNEQTNTAFAQATDLTSSVESRYAAALDFAAKSGVDIEPYLAARVFSYMTAAEIVQASRDGFSIELHTHNHTLGDFSFDTVAREIQLNRQTLGTLLDRRPETFRHFCYPSGVALPTVGHALSRLGVSTGTTLESGIAQSGSNEFFLPRILDGDHLSAIEFEAQISGLADLVRDFRGSFRRGLDRKPHGGKPPERGIEPTA